MLSGAPGGGDERGFTLVELLVTMTVLMLVTGALLSALDSATRTERRASTRIDDEQAVRLVLAQLTRDVRGAAGVRPETTLPDQLDLDEVGGAHVRWSYDSAGARQTLTRSTVSGSGQATAGVSAGGLANTAGSVAPLSLLGRTGDLATLAGGTAADAVRCAVAVQVQVVSAAHPPTAPFTETVVADLHPADLQGCP